MAKKKTQEFTAGYTFNDPAGKSLAVLDPSGRFTLKDDGGGIEVFPHWHDFMKKMKVEVIAGDEEFALAQIQDVIVGEPVKIQRTAVAEPESQPLSPRPEKLKDKTAETAQSKEETDMKAATKTAPAKKAAPAKKDAAKSTKPAGELKPCPCGCGTKIARNFAQGHDARVHGWAKKIAAGTMQLTELKAITQAWMSEHKVKQGKAPAAK